MKQRNILTYRRGWTPIRRGPVYCSPHCGGRCRYQDYRMAHLEANALAKKLGKPWVPRVWENLGWHWEVAAKCGAFHFTLWGCAHKNYTCAISTMGGAGLPGIYDDRSFSTPDRAIRASLRVFTKLTNSYLEAISIMCREYKSRKI